MKKKIWYPLVFLGNFGLAASIGLSVSKMPNSNQNQEHAVLDNHSIKAVNQVATLKQGETVGAIRRSQNNNFQGIQLNDGGLAVLTGNVNDGYAVTRTNAFGGVEWSFNPEDVNGSFASKNIENKFKNQAISEKAVIEIRQDAILPNTFYALLVPKDAIPDQTTGLVSSTHTYDEINEQVKLQASVVQLTQTVDKSQAAFTYIINNVVSIPPRAMVNNYPSQWKVDSNGGPDFFSPNYHKGWYENNKFVLPWAMYITNMGNLYGINGTVLMFGGNGTVFENKQALSIGMFRLNFGLPLANNSRPVEITGIPYAYILAGIQANSFNPITDFEFTNAPIGQNKNFKYVPRMAVGGVSGPVNNDPNAGYIYLAGSLTVGQDKSVQTENSDDSDSTIVGRSVTNNNGTSGAQNSDSSSATVGYGSLNDSGFITNVTSAPYSDIKTRFNSLNGTTNNGNKNATNFLPSHGFLSGDTTGNSKTPLTVFGTQLSVSSLLSIATSESSEDADKRVGIKTLLENDTSWLFSMLDPSKYSLGVNPGFTYAFNSKGNPPSESRVNDPRLYLSVVPDESKYDAGRYGYVARSEDGRDGAVVGRPQQLWDAGLGVFTSLFGYSPKSVGNLATYAVDNSLASHGYIMQIGAFIYYFSLNRQDGFFQQHGTSPVTDVTKSGIAAPKLNEFEVTKRETQIKNTNGRFLIAAFLPNYWREPNDLFYNYSATVAKNSSTTIASDASGNKNLSWSNFIGTSTGSNLSTTSASKDVSVLSLWSSGNNDVTTNAVLVRGFSGSGETYYDRTQYQNPSLGRVSVTLYDSTTKGVVSLKDPSVPPGQVSTNVTKENPSVIIQKPRTTGNFFSQTKNSGIIVLKPSSSGSFLETVGNYSDWMKASEVTLGSGNFRSNLPESIKTKSLAELIEEKNENGTSIEVVRSQYFDGLFDYTFKNQVKPEDRRILVTNKNISNQSATFSAQLLNPINRSWQTIPDKNGSVLKNQNVAYSNGSFGNQPEYLLAVAIAVPLFVVAVILGLGIGIGIPMQKNKKALQQGFDISHRKVDTLTTAVGSVFKQIINRTQIGNIKKTPQLLKKAPDKKPSPPVKPPVSPQKPLPPGVSA